VVYSFGCDLSRDCDLSELTHSLMRFHFQFRRYRLPFQRVVRTAHGPWGEREGVLVRIENEASQVGYGEAAPIPWFGTETVDDVETGCRALGEWIEAETLDAVPEQLGCLRNALSIARTELMGRAELADVPDLGVAALLPAGRAALAELLPKGDAGFRVFKWKVGVGDVDAELGWLDDLCGALPDGAKLRLDANGAWDSRRAARWLERCAERPIEFVEQPIASDARGAEDLLLGLAGDFPTPIAIDESLVLDGDVERWLGVGWPGVYILKPSLLSNPTAALERLSAAKANVVFSSALETAVGAKSALRLAFRWKGTRHAIGFGVWPLFADARFDGPYSTPFLSQADVERIDPESLWNALS
jgi:O-succinylbenzoate synthase